MDAGSTQRWLGQALFEHWDVCVVVRAAHFKDTAGLANSYFGANLLLQVLNKLVAQLSSQAKKAGAFFSMSMSPLSCLFSSSSCLMR